jgi:hypothetical protein
MQSKNLEFVLAQAQDPDQKHPIGKAVAASAEVGVVVPSILRGKLQEAGYTLVDDKVAVAEYGFASLGALKRVLVTDEDGTLVAMGAAGNEDEALLAAMLGWFRENPLPGADVPAGIAEAPTQPE